MTELIQICGTTNTYMILAFILFFRKDPFNFFTDYSEIHFPFQKNKVRYALHVFKFGF